MGNYNDILESLAQCLQLQISILHPSLVGFWAGSKSSLSSHIFFSHSSHISPITLYLRILYNIFNFFFLWVSAILEIEMKLYWRPRSVTMLYYVCTCKRIIILIWCECHLTDYITVFVIVHLIGDTLGILRSELKSQRKLVKSLKKKSLWSKSMEEVIECVSLSCWSVFWPVFFSRRLLFLLLFCTDLWYSPVVNIFRPLKMLVVWKTNFMLYRTWSI